MAAAQHPVDILLPVDLPGEPVWQVFSPDSAGIDEFLLFS